MQSIKVLQPIDFIRAKEQTVQGSKRIQILNNLKCTESFAYMKYKPGHREMLNSKQRRICNKKQVWSRMSHPDAVRAQLQHLEARQLIEVCNACNLIMKQEELLDFCVTLQSLNLPQ